MNAGHYAHFTVTLALAFPGGCNCSERSDAAPAWDAGADARVEASPDASAHEDGSIADSSTDADAKECVEYPYVPGWHINGEWSCDCRLFDPGPDAELPERGTWEKCPVGVMDSIDCRVLMPPPGQSVTPLGTSVDINPASGKPTVSMTYDIPDRFHPVSRAFVVFEADGPTLGAMVQQTPTAACWVRMENMNEGKVILSVVGDGSIAPESLDLAKQGILGGSINGPLSHLLYRYDSPASLEFTLGALVSSDLLVRVTRTYGLAASDWGLSSWSSIHETGTDPEGLRAWDTVVVGKNVFHDVSQGGAAYYMSWDPEHGSRPLLRWYGDRTQAASNFGSDGKDMVWTYARRQKARHDYQFDEYTMMTAPITTDPTVLQSTMRPVRAEYDPVFLPEADYRVGCGYAAHVTRGAHLAIVRLSDGAQWVVNRLPPPDTDKWSFYKALGVTCDEVFVGISTQVVESVARIKLSSLGAPTMPNQ